MTWQEEWTNRALRDLRGLDRAAAMRILDAVADLAQAGRGDVVRLQGVRPPEWRLRVGDVRVRFIYDREAGLIRILRVLPRGRAYRD